MRPLRRDFSDHVATKIDKDRRTAAQKARDAKVTSDAKTDTMNAVLQMPPEDRVRYSEGVLDGLRAALTVHEDAALACSIIASKAHQPIAELGSKGRAEQAFAKLTRADNDRGESE